MAEQVKELQSLFGKPDRKGNDIDGAIQSEYPAYMMNSQIDGLDNGISELEADLNGGRIPGGDIFEAKEELTLLQNKFDDIVRSKPNYSPSEEKFLHEELERMNRDMSDTLYSRYDQQKGKGSIARPQQEADLNDKPCIKINSEIARICNINNVVEGQASRNQIDKARKILCYYFERDDASREAHRPENNASRGRPMVGYTNRALAKRYREIFPGRKAFDPNKLNEEDTAERLQDEIITLQKRISKLKSENEEVSVLDPNSVVIAKEIPVREIKEGKKYICPEPECGFVGKLTQKGAHIRMHNKQRADEAEALKEE